MLDRSMTERAHCRSFRPLLQAQSVHRAYGNFDFMISWPRVATRPSNHLKWEEIICVGGQAPPLRILGPMSRVRRLPNNRIVSLRLDADGHLCRGTTAGLTRYKDGWFARFDSEDALGSEFTEIERDLWQRARQWLRWHDVGRRY